MNTEIRTVDSSIFGVDYLSTNTNVEGISTVYSCVRLIAQTIAQTDLLHKSDENEVLKNSTLTKRLVEPQKNQSYYNWMLNMTRDLILRGNGYAIILSDELLYIPEPQVQVYITNQEENPYFYQITNQGKSFRVFPENILHFRNISSDGIIGMNPIAMHSATFDSALSMSDYASKFVDNAAQISGVIETPKKLNKETIEQLRTNFSNKFSGSANAGKVPVLTEDMKFKQLNRISPLDLDYINSAKLNKSQISEIFQVPLVFLSTDMTYNNSESQSLIFQNYTINPLLRGIEQEMSIKLGETLKFQVDSIKQASTKEKSDSLSLLVNTGILTPNESRKHFGLPAIKGGDEIKASEDSKAAPKNTEDTNNPSNMDKSPSKRSK